MSGETDKPKGPELDDRILLLDDAGATAAGFRDGLYNSTPISLLNLGRPELEIEPHLAQNPHYSTWQTIGNVAGVAGNIAAALGAAYFLGMALNYINS